MHRSGRRIALGAMCASGVLGVPRAASADDARVSFSWTAPEGCPTSAEVEAWISARLHERVSSRGHDVRAVAVADKGAVRVRVTADDAERTIVAPTCAAAADAIAVIVALAVDGAEPPLPVEATAAPEPISFRTAAREAPVSAARPEERARWSLFAAGAMDAASLPRTSPGAAVGVDLRRGWLAAGVSVSAYLPQVEYLSGAPPVQATIGLVDAMASVCARVPLGWSIDFGPCAGAGVGFLYGRSDHVSNPGAGMGARPQGAIFGRVRFPLANATALRFEAGALGDPVRSPFRIIGVGDVYRPAAVSLRASLGVEFQLRDGS